MAEFPECPSDAAANCTWQQFWNLMYSPQCYGKQFCRTITYDTDDRRSKWTNLISPCVKRLRINHTGLSFQYQLTTTSSSRGARVNMPFKSVRNEVYIWESLPFIANLGGILSMLLGFSCIEAGKQMITILKDLVSFKFEKDDALRNCVANPYRLILPCL